MALNSTLLCIHRDPAQLSPLRERGYELLTATNGHEGLRLFMSQPVDAILLEYHLGLLDGGIVAAEIKKVKPQVPIVMLTDSLELPDDALKSVDALVTRSDGDHFLWATVHFVLNMKPTEKPERKLKSDPFASLHRQGLQDGGLQGEENTSSRPANTLQLAIDDPDIPFSPRVWRSIRNGTVRF